jgi:hypothetical protein
VLAHHVEVVEQPFAGGSDVDIVSGGGEALVGFIEYPAGVVQASQETRARQASSAGSQVLSRRDFPGSLGELLRPE